MQTLFEFPNIVIFELQSKLLKEGYIGLYIEESSRAY